jgi:hypothetical protein
MLEAECGTYKAVEMKAGFLGLKVGQATGFRKTFSSVGLRKLFDDGLHDFRLRDQQAELSLGRQSVLCRTDALRLLQLGIRVVLGALLLLPVTAAFLLFCAVAICTDKPGRKR